jgi:hypothetical protein
MKYPFASLLPTPTIGSAVRSGRWLLVAVLLLGLVAGPVCATITNGTVTGGKAFTAGGTFNKLTPPLPNSYGDPDSVGKNNFQSSNLYGFDEVQSIVLSAPLVVDVGSSPIPAGTAVASHYIFFDPARPQNIQGTVDFDSVVLGIITSKDNLNDSDFLANTGVNYVSSALRGLEGGDVMTIVPPNQITFKATAGSPGDYVRVVTAASAEASTPTVTSTGTPTGAGTSTPVVTDTPAATATAPPTGAPTNTPTVPTITPTNLPTATPSETQTQNPTPTATVTPGLPSPIPTPPPVGLLAQATGEGAGCVTVNDGRCSFTVLAGVVVLWVARRRFSRR